MQREGQEFHSPPLRIALQHPRNIEASETAASRRTATFTSLVRPIAVWITLGSKSDSSSEPIEHTAAKALARTRSSGSSCLVADADST